ncbi:enoyl-CoA hydratase/isomerase family protein [Desulfofundulus thermosubterraneus]|uniref:enoyl-CoA hydratase/isomerase family protein n=1 Tax=Desulfofundulus thermosubterraneus TaxID=348840 RepID=UPI0013F4D7A5|nr:enoyl-CoA hydratase/isomerase family protein [Desulfofundulus thermosubterraneus]
MEREESVCRVFLNKPESLNALDLEMRAELSDIIEAVRSDPKIKAMIISGKGRAFCAGGDIKSMQQPFKPLDGRKRLKELHRWLTNLIHLPIPVIAAVNGIAAGAGCNLALASDIIIASVDAKFAQSFVKVGLIPDTGGLYFLPRLIGLNRAKELMFTGRMIDAQEAKEIGLVNKVVEADKLLPMASQLAFELANGATNAIALTKRILNLSLNSDLESVLEFEALAQDICFGTEHFIEGRNAFLEKRKPVFK